MSCFGQRPRHIRYLNISQYLYGSSERKAAIAAKRASFASSQSGTADEALDAIPPQIGYSNSVGGSGGGQATLEMLGGPEETLG